MPINSTPRAVVDEPKGTIYGLVDPRDGRLRYVGQTISSLYCRFSGHLRDRSKNSAKVCWIDELRQLGLKPQMLRISEHSISELDKEEIGLIAFFRSLGTPLLNVRPGGGGPRQFAPRQTVDVMGVIKAEEPIETPDNPWLEIQPEFDLNEYMKLPPDDGFSPTAEWTEEIQAEFDKQWQEEHDREQADKLRNKAYRWADRAIKRHKYAMRGQE